ncbi:vacuolar sorting protein, Vps52/Sac2 family protein [Pseudohyphozyma bogoriensis]|nr:vacuolar sorting protein, Vps52/Sac2 family protein [Pseudohyphozyma bogoriensis]
MATISQFIGHSAQSPAQVLTHPRIDPDEYPAFAASASALKKDVRVAYDDALKQVQDSERANDHFFLDRAREYVELNEQVETSTALLTDLSAFLSTFQRDLSAVSGHISELQGRSKTIEGRLAARKAVESSLQPLLSSIILPPPLLQTLLTTPVSNDWIEPITALSSLLSSIRSGPRVASRKSLDDAAEAIRIHCASSILTHLLNLLKPFTIALPSLTTLQSSTLIPQKPLFDFLRSHAPLQAHEFQKAYSSTVRWYYETGFRRYVRSLEKIRVRSKVVTELIGNAKEVPALSLLKKPDHHLLPQQQSNTPLDYAQVEGPGVVMGFMSSDSSFKPSCEALFRSISVVLLDNATSEYSFLSAFFGEHSALPSLGSGMGGSMMSLTSPDGGLGDNESESGRTSVGGRSLKDERSEKLRKTILDGLWKGVMDPALEYCQNFVTALLDPASLPSPITLLTMIILTERIIVTASTQCPSLETHLVSLRLLLWPAFSKAMTANVESVQKINAPGGVFGKGVKDSQVKGVSVRYVDMFNEMVRIWDGREEGEEMVFSSALRLRQEIDKLLVFQAQKIADPAKQKAFLHTHYEEIMSALSAGLSTNLRSQKEVSHYRELIRKLG